MKEKTIVSTSVLLCSLLSYWYARNIQRDAVPYVMLGGFIGSVVGETVANRIVQNKK
jgi:uncharacterized membrane protein YfcA